jgi:hypothetical protein
MLSRERNKEHAEAQKRGQTPIVRSTLRAIWLLVSDPFSELSHAVFYRETGNYRKTQIFPAKTACFKVESAC